MSARKGSRVGDELIEAFEELAAFLRGEETPETYEVSNTVLTPARIRIIRKKVAPSTKEFERRFHVPARTMEAYEQGRRRPKRGNGDAPSDYRSRTGCSAPGFDVLTHS